MKNDSAKNFCIVFDLAEFYRIVLHHRMWAWSGHFQALKANFNLRYTRVNPEPCQFNGLVMEDTNDHFDTKRFVKANQSVEDTKILLPFTDAQDKETTMSKALSKSRNNDLRISDSSHITGGLTEEETDNEIELPQKYHS